MRLKGLTLFLQISQSLWIFYPSLSRHRSEYPGFISPIPLQLSHSLSIIGFKPGTGGTEGVGYLRSMLDTILFPELWRLRSNL